MTYLAYRTSGVNLSGRARPLLLASVREPGEARAALDAGVDLLDVKEPRHGSLGPVDPEILRAIVALRDARAEGQPPARTPVSVALGDAPDPPSTTALAALAAACGADYLKIGLRGIRHASEAIDRLRSIVAAARAASPSVRIVAAAFADDDPAGSLPVLDLPAVAASGGASGCLIDTLRKDGGALPDRLGIETLAAFATACRERGMLSALAGSIGIAHLPRLLAIGPDLIGTRGALCGGGRDGALDPALVIAFRDALRAA